MLRRFRAPSAVVAIYNSHRIIYLDSISSVDQMTFRVGDELARFSGPALEFFGVNPRACSFERRQMPYLLISSRRWDPAISLKKDGDLYGL